MLLERQRFLLLDRPYDARGAKSDGEDTMNRQPLVRESSNVHGCPRIIGGRRTCRHSRVDVLIPAWSSRSLVDRVDLQAGAEPDDTLVEFVLSLAALGPSCDSRILLFDTIVVFGILPLVGTARNHRIAILINGLCEFDIAWGLSGIVGVLRTTTRQGRRDHDCAWDQEFLRTASRNRSRLIA